MQKFPWRNFQISNYHVAMKLEADIPIGSIVYLTIDNCDGGMGIVLSRDGYMYTVYRITHDDKIVTNSWEMHVEWNPCD